MDQADRLGRARGGSVAHQFVGRFPLPPGWIAAARLVAYIAWTDRKAINSGALHGGAKVGEL
jgi:hypothetical protein